MNAYTEDTLAQQTTADYLAGELGWDSVYAYNNETFGPEGTLGRKDDREIVLTRYLGEALITLNPGLSDTAYQDAIRQILEYTTSSSTLQINREKYALLKDGVLVQFRDEKGELKKQRLRVFDFEDAGKNHFLCVREMWIRGSIYRRRADIIGFVNGIPLLFMELKNVHRDIRRAYEENLADYKETVPHLFHHNAMIVLGNGVEAKLGSLSAKFEHFNEWKRLEEDAPGVVEMETLLKGVCSKQNFIDLFENFILFDESSGAAVKIIARNHQFLGVNRAVQAVRERKQRQGKLGVFWHTQGSGKSYSMAMFTRKVHRKLGGNYTFLICTDREDLDTQIYKTFAGCGLADNDKEPCRASGGKHLKALLERHQSYVFTLVQKFNQDVDPDDPYSERDDIIVISDEAHRTQYGRLALNLRNALPHAGFIGFTGTPLFANDEITRRVFGEYVSTYDFQRAVEDNATVPLYYDARGDKLGVSTGEINDRIAEKLEELEIDDINTAERLERELKRDYHIVTANKRLNQVAEDFVQHYSTAWESGKAMFVCIDKLTCVRMFNRVQTRWQARIAELEKEIGDCTDDQQQLYLEGQLAWMLQTQMAVMVSEEQGEIDRFRKEKLDILSHRKLIKEGFNTPDGGRIDLEDAFKKDDHPFRIVFVCAMWLTGFDVPSLANLYLDKPLKAHTLMQAIARANRVHAGKNNGLIVDYCGILKSLRKALATFAGHQGGAPIGGGSGPEVDPVRPDEDLLADLDESVEMVRAFLEQQGFRLDLIIESQGFSRNKAIVDAKEAVNESDETRKRFEILCREVFRKFKACITLKGINAYRHRYDAINIIYKSLQGDKMQADISDIIRALHEIVDESIVPKAPDSHEGEDRIYDISRIDFDRLRKEFEKSPAKRSAVQMLKDVIEKKLARMLAQNPLRTDFQKHYEEIIAEYNREKDRVTIEKTFEELMRVLEELDDEEMRAVREGLDEETLALFDLLKKPGLSKKEIDRIKGVATELLSKLKAERLNVDHWRDKQATRDAVKVAIHDFLYDDRSGLPEPTYSGEEVEEKTATIYRHIFQQYASATQHM